MQSQIYDSNQEHDDIDSNADWHNEDIGETYEDVDDDILYQKISD